MWMKDGYDMIWKDGHQDSLWERGLRFIRKCPIAHASVYCTIWRMPLLDLAMLTIPLIFLILECAVAFIFLPRDIRFLDTDRLILIIFVLFFQVTKSKCCMLRNNFVNLQLSEKAQLRFISIVNKQLQLKHLTPVVRKVDNAIHAPDKSLVSGYISVNKTKQSIPWIVIHPVCG